MNEKPAVTESGTRFSRASMSENRIMNQDFENRILSGLLYKGNLFKYVGRERGFEPLQQEIVVRTRLASSSRG